MKACDGVCVAEKIADYCEAYITTPDLCAPELRCCVSSDSFGDKLPYNVVIPNKNKNVTRISTTKPKVTTEYHYKTSKPITKIIPTKPMIKQCEGECVNGFLALFCDDIDTTAECPDEASCCITNSAVENERPLITTPRPVLTTTPRPPPPTESGPRCPGYCLINIMAAFCERPSVLIPHTSNCKRGSVCCDNTRVVTTTPRPRPKPNPPLQTTPPQTTAKPTNDPRVECPGSCIVSYLSFTCFRKY